MLLLLICNDRFNMIPQIDMVGQFLVQCGSQASTSILCNKVGCALPVRELSPEPSEGTNAPVRATHYIHDYNIRFF